MVKCYYCSCEITDTETAKLDGAYLEVCKDCQQIIKRHGVDKFEAMIAKFDGHVVRAKQYIDFFDMVHEIPNGETIKSMKDGDAMVKNGCKGYTVDELFDKVIK